MAPPGHQNTKRMLLVLYPKAAQNCPKGLSGPQGPGPWIPAVAEGAEPSLGGREGAPPKAPRCALGTESRARRICLENAPRAPSAGALCAEGQPKARRARPTWERAQRWVTSPGAPPPCLPQAAHPPDVTAPWQRLRRRPRRASRARGGGVVTSRWAEGRDVGRSARARAARRRDPPMSSLRSDERGRMPTGSEAAGAAPTQSGGPEVHRNMHAKQAPVSRFLPILDLSRALVFFVRVRGVGVPPRGL